MYYERVNSHVAAGCFFFALCGMKDVSRELMDLEKHAATKIQLSKGFLFANLETAREFQEQRAAFFQVCTISLSGNKSTKKTMLFFTDTHKRVGIRQKKQIKNTT